MSAKNHHPVRRTPVTAILLSVLLLSVAACSSGGADWGDSPSSSVTVVGPEEESATATTQPTTVETSWSATTASGTFSADFSDKDLDASETVAPSASIKLAGDSATVEGSGVTVDRTLVTIISAGVFRLAGTLDDGQIVVDAGASSDVRLILDGVDITCSNSAPLYVRNADKVVITLATGTVNHLTDGDTYVLDGAASDEPDAALFSNDDLTINGTGSLTVEANYHDGIKSDDDLRIVGGSITVTAANDGVKGRDSVAIKDGTLTIAAGGDGIQASNDEDVERGYVVIEGGTVVITSGGDGVQAETGLVVDGGDVTINAGAGSTSGGAYDASTISTKGMKAGADLTITGGTFAIDSCDDALHSNGSLAIADGEFLMATGDDGIHAETTLQIDGGDITITTSYEGIEGASVTINAGNIHLTSEDDGINTIGGSDGSTADAEPGQPGQGGPGPGDGGSGDYPLYVNGGYLMIDAMGDGIDVNGPINMTGGVIIINGPVNNANGPIDYLGSFTITGGFLVAVGSSGMAQAPDQSSTQPSAGLAWRSPQAGGTMIHLATEDGEDILTFVPTKQFQSLVLSSAELEIGATYVAYTGGSSTGTAVDGLYSEGTYTPGTEAGSFTLES